MIHLPTIRRITKPQDLKQFSALYLKASSLPVPMAYLSNPQNRVYAVYYRSTMIGGYILAKGETMRTLEVFAQEDARAQLYQSIDSIKEFTEITCFWMKASMRRSTSINTFVWLSLAFCLRFFGTPKILFGTCSSSLARLYGVTPKSELIHTDRVNGKRTYIFQSERSVCLSGFVEIIRFKLRRAARIRRRSEEIRGFGRVS